jgi:hypothetical protein
MNEFFYSALSEWLKILSLILLFLIVGAAIWRSRKRADANWKSWIHGAVIVTFLLNAVYCFNRCLTTDPLKDMIIRRFFAFEAEFSFACASFYFLITLFLKERSNKESRGS